MDLGMLGTLTFDAAFFSALASIVLIDLILAGDNAVVIAMAVRSLPREHRRRGILLGSAAAVLLRVVATFFVAQLLRAPYVKLVGGLLIGWIAVKLFVEGTPDEVGERAATSVWQAVRVIVIADITMALDNMLAVGGASHGNIFLLLFGLALSIPFVVFTSGLLSMLMDRYPAIVYVGAAILGKVAAEMVLTDPVVAAVFALPARALWVAEALTAAGVIAAGKLWLRWTAARAERRERPAEAGAGRNPQKQRRVSTPWPFSRSPASTAAAAAKSGAPSQRGSATPTRTASRCWPPCARRTRAGSASATSTTSTSPRSGNASTGRTAGTRRCCSATSSRPPRPTASSSSAAAARSCSPGSPPRCTCASSRRSPRASSASCGASTPTTTASAR